jgi:lipopolysaccharide export system permease protein
MLVTRYLFKNLCNATIFIALTLTLVIWLTQSLKLLELVANSDAPPGMFLHLIALTLPKFLEIILPLSLVIAVIFTYNRLIMDNEIIVLRACGIDQYALARPAIGLAIGTSLLLNVISAYISPICVSEVQTLRETIKNQYSAFLLRDGVFNTFGSDLTIYLRERQDNGDMAGLMIFDARDKSKPAVTVTAKTGRIEMNQGTPNIIVFDGMRQQMDPGNGTISKLYFSSYTIEIKGLEGTAEQHWKESSERTLPELLNPDLTNKRDRANVDAFRAEAHNRLITPWNALCFTMIALTVVLLGPFNRRGQHIKIAIACGFIILMQVLSLAFINIAKKHLGAVPLLYINTLVPVALGLYFLHLRGEQTFMAIMRRWHLHRNRTLKGSST